MPPPGRPPAEQKTDQTRAWADQVEKLQWLYRLRGIRSAEFIGPRIQADLDAEFELIRPMVEQLQAQEAAAAAVRDEAPVLSNSLADGEGR